MIIYPVNLYNKTLNLADQCLQHNIDYTFHLHKVIELSLTAITDHTYKHYK